MGKCTANRNAFAADGFLWWMLLGGKCRTFLWDGHIAILKSDIGWVVFRILLSRFGSIRFLFQLKIFINYLTKHTV